MTAGWGPPNSKFPKAGREIALLVVCDVHGTDLGFVYPWNSHLLGADSRGWS